MIISQSEENMNELILNFNASADVTGLIEESEKAYNEQIAKTVRDIISEEDVKIIALAGPTCSGKTTTSERLITEFKKYGKTLINLSIDDFFYDRNLEIVLDPSIDSPMIETETITRQNMFISYQDVVTRLVVSEDNI